MKFLVTTVETYRVDSENEAQAAINDAKTSKEFALMKYSTEKKEVKAKGEVVDVYWKVQLHKSFNDIKDPDTEISVSYNKE